MIRTFILALSLGFFSLVTGPAYGANTSSNESTKVFFVEPKDGATVTSPVKVKFGLEGMQIGKLGDLAQGMGHHHLVIDGKPVPKGEVVPADETHVHFGKGQTETELPLSPGEHTITLQFADGAHRSYGNEMSNTIKVKVAGKAVPAAAQKK
jgi:hypothetical protein